ncbi:MAG: glycosyl hydrolase family 18 protein [Acidobacteriaceae bacterium]|nr:glycosyl hydrolase family 18 protein [Acidobacteriaceae bacterium]
MNFFCKTLAAFAVGAASLGAAAQAVPRPLVIAYVRGPNHTLQPGEVDPTKITRVHYAFLHTKDGGIALAGSDDANLKYLVGLKNKVKSFQVLISVGGGGDSGDFSDIALTDESRAKFNASCIEVLENYGLDGVDVDWEYPAAPRADKRSRAIDKQNYTLLLHDMRQALDLESKKLHKPLYLSSATNGKRFFLRNTEMGEAAKYLDTVALMGYDVFGPNGTTTGHHSPLFTSPASPAPVSDDQFIRDYEAAGVPAAKIVLGAPFYGYIWTDVPAAQHGLFQTVTPRHAKDITFRIIATTYLTPNSGFVRYWDDKAEVPFLYNETTKEWISYEDARSIEKKAAYTREHGLAGMMFWDLGGDSDNTLLNAIEKGLGLTTQ